MKTLNASPPARPAAAGGKPARSFRRIRRPAGPGPASSRPNGAPAYYLGRPASLWITAMNPRRRRTRRDRADLGSDALTTVNGTPGGTGHRLQTAIRLSTDRSLSD